LESIHANTIAKNIPPRSAAKSNRLKDLSGMNNWIISMRMPIIIAIRRLLR
jgi:hypothetical protein